MCSPGSSKEGPCNEVVSGRERVVIFGNFGKLDLEQAGNTSGVPMGPYWLLVPPQGFSTEKTLDNHFGFAQTNLDGLVPRAPHQRQANEFPTTAIGASAHCFCIHQVAQAFP